MTEPGLEHRSDDGMPTVFVSYASQDGAVATAVVESLERSGLKCWIAPRDVMPGVPYAGQIIHAIDGSKVVVLVLSRDSAASPHVLREVERAASTRHAIVALRIDQAPLPADLEYFLNSSHWMDASSTAVPASMPKLEAAVRAAILTFAPTEAKVVASGVNVSRAPARAINRTALVIASIVGLAIAGFAAERAWLFGGRVSSTPTPAAAKAITAPAAPAVPEKSVAVLPFVDMSEKQDQEYFSDGLSEELIDMLTKIPDLRVPARTSSFYFKGKAEDIPTIAKRLMVANILEGSVRKSGKRLRVTAQLVRADNGYHLWSQTYDRTFNDIFKIQDEIAEGVVQALKASLSGDFGHDIAGTRNADAYQFYLQGLAILKHAWKKAEIERAAAYFQQAIKADPNFADPWAGLVLVCADLIRGGHATREALSGKLQHALDQLAKLAPNDEKTHEALVQVHLIDLDWSAANAEVEKIYELDPRNALNLRHLAESYWLFANEPEEALRLYHRAIELDPVSANSYASLSDFLIWSGRISEAEDAARRALDLDPTMPGAHLSLAKIFLKRNDFPQALAEVQRDSSEANRRQGLALVYWTMGRRSESDEALEQAESMDGNVNPYGIAQVHAFRGEIDQALAWLDRAYLQRDLGIMETNRDPLLQGLRGDSRFKALLLKWKLP